MIRNDDLNGDEDADTVTIVVNGRGVELDLAKRSMDKLMKALEPFWSAAPEAAYSVTKGRAARASQGISAKQQRIAEQGFVPAEVRAWAAANGVAVPQMGRVPQAVVDQYKAAQ